MPLRDNEVKRVGTFGAEKRALASHRMRAQTVWRRFGPTVAVVLIGGTLLIAFATRCVG